MAKSMRSKRKRRLRTLRREIAEPFYEKKEQAKLAAQEAALAAPKLEIPPVNKTQMEIEPVDGEDDREPMAIEGNDSKKFKLKPVGGIEKEWKSNKKLKREKRLKRKRKKKLSF